MKFGGPFPYTGPLATPENMALTAKTAERLGFDYIWIGDHLIYPKTMKSKYPHSPDGSLPIDPRHNFFEIFTSLSFIAAHTSKIELTTNVVIAALRQPAVLARQIASLDVISGGRFGMVVGLGWMEDEYEAANVAWAERGAITDESILALRALFAEQPFEGPHFRFGATHFYPKPTKSPFPIWIGGDSDAAIRRAARLGDGWKPVGPARESTWRAGANGAMATRARWLKEKHAYAMQVREQAGRRGEPLPLASSIGMLDTASDALTMSDRKDQILDDIAQLAGAGVSQISVLLNELNSTGPLQKILDEAQWFAEEIFPLTRDL